MKFITRSKKVNDMASNKLKNQNVISEMIYPDITDELLKKAEIIISETLLYDEISKYMAKEDPGATICSLVCEDNHIDMTVAISRKWGGFGFDVRLIIQDVEVSNNRQVISFHAEYRKVAYNNIVERLSGKMTGVTILKRIVGMIVRTIIDHIFKLNDPPSNYTDSIIYSPIDSLFIVNLSQIEQIQKLAQPLLGVEDCVLDFICFEAMHKHGKISILPYVFDKDRMMQSVIASQFVYFTLQDN